MDDCPGLPELLQHIKIGYGKINKLKRQLGVDIITKGLRERKKLENILQSWIETNGANATRRHMIGCLVCIGEQKIATEYWKFSCSLEKSKGEFASIFKTVQEENASVDIRVMQCMPLGPPRVGKTCLKKRLLNEEVPSFPDDISPSTPISTEKQTINVESPKVSTIEAQNSAWKHLQWEDEVFSLVMLFKSMPQSLYHSLRSFGRKKSFTFNILAISLGVLLYTLFYSLKVLILVFFFLSSVKSLYDFASTMDSNTGIQYSLLFHCAQVIVLVLHYFEVYTIYLLIAIIVLMVFTGTSECNVLWPCLFDFLYFFFYSSLFFRGVFHSDFVFISALYVLVIGNNRFLVAFLQTWFPKLLKNETPIMMTAFYAFEVIFWSSDSLSATLVSFVRIVIAIILFCFNIPMKLKWTFKFLLVGILIITSRYFGFNFIGETEFLQFINIIRDTYTVLVLILLYKTERIVDIDNSDSENSIVSTAMKNVTDIQPSNANSTLKIYFTDSGGQPEFQEVLPSLLSGPTVFFLVFNLQKGLSAQYEVKYVGEKNSKFRPYTTKFTVMDALLQCLASISCLGEYSKTQGKKNFGIKPKVYFIGTHRDLVTKAQVCNLDKELKEAIKNTSWYKKDMIQFPSDEQDLIFSVSNFDKNDASFSILRESIESLSKLKNAGYNMKIPAPWLGLEFTLRAHEENVMSISDCLKLAKSQCSISDREELNDALWFLHNKLGSVRHYQQIPELRDTVITKPQILFQIVTDLLVSTFPLGGSKVNREFRETGRFTRKELQEIGNIDSTSLTVKQVIALLRYLHILASLKINSRGNECYFLPCALSHAPKPDTNQLSSKGNLNSAALLVGFKCGYSPKGVFCALISYMLENSHDGMRCHLIENCIFRDQATLEIGGTGYCLTITYLPKFLHLELREPESVQSSDSTSAPGNKMHTLVWTSISKGLSVVTPRLNYTCEADPVFGFYCVHTSCRNDEPHPAYFLNKRSPDILTCSIERRNTFKITEDQKKWFSVVPFHTRMLNKLLKVCFNLYYLPLKYKILLGMLIFAVILFFGQMNFDIHKLTEKKLVVKQTLLNHYTTLCADSSTGLPCELKKILNQGEYTQPIRPIRLILNSTNNFSAFRDLKANCSFAIIALFEDCYPKKCKNLVRVIQNGLINYLSSCPLRNDLCWPILNHITGFDSIQLLIQLFNSLTGQKLPESFPKVENILYFYYRFYYTFYRFGQDQCTEDVLSSMEKKELGIEDILSILKFALYTHPELSPALILSSFDNAAQKPYNSNTRREFKNILHSLGEKASASNWLIPVIATAENHSWFETTMISSSPLKEYFPIEVNL